MITRGPAPHPAHRQSPPDTVEIELIRTLFQAFVPALVMSVGFAGAGTLIVLETGNASMRVMLVVGCILSVIRLSVALFYRRDVRRDDLTIQEARRYERRFGIPYLAFSGVLGVFGVQTLQYSAPDLHMLMICLLAGYGAGVASGIGLRPLISIPSILVALGPTSIVAITNGRPAYVCTGLLIAGLLAGGTQSILVRYRRALRHTRQRLTFSVLAREDGLTELPNRLALREWFDVRLSGKRAPGLFAVHCLDINGFKPINDNYGHPIGDALLTAIARRIAGTIRETDIAARLGGDEFAIIQHGISGEEEAELLAQRLAATLARPFQLGELRIQITASIGYVRCDDRVEELEALLSLADEALYASKRTNNSVTGINLADRVERWAA